MNKEGRIGIYYLREIWKYYNDVRHQRSPQQPVEWKYVNGVFNTLGIGTEPTLEYLLNFSTSFDDFESWIEQNGELSRNIIEYFNSIIDDEGKVIETTDEVVFNEDDLEQWDRDGYVVLKEAISQKDCQATVAYICDELGVDLSDPQTWYQPHPLKNGIMVQLFNAPTLDKNRLSKRIKLAFQQLWKQQNLLVSMDRVSFNPPETDSYQFPGPNLHWDVSLKQPIPYGLQGLLYLVDTTEDQGAFTVIPGFHNFIGEWLGTLEAQPREVNLLDVFDEKPIAANAGDLIIWNHCLPHGSRPNHSNFPRIVQYINYQPLNMECQNEWI